MQEEQCEIQGYIQQDANVEIVGVSNITKYQSCCICNKKVTINGPIASCSTCKMDLKVSRCKRDWFMKPYVEHIVSKKSQLLSVYTEVATNLASLVQVVISNVTPKDFTLELLQIETLHITYDNVDKTLLHVSN